MKTLLFTTMSIFLISSVVFADVIPDNINTEVQKDDPTVNERWKNALGTFQLEILKGRELTEININIINEIEAARHQTKITYIQYNDRVRIKILPFSMLNDPNNKLELRKHVDKFVD